MSKSSLFVCCLVLLCLVDLVYRLGRIAGLKNGITGSWKCGRRS